MARTAPVPNIPPIPGMCPGTIVLAGGAGGSGDGSGDGADGDGKNGANGGKGENDPNGDGKGGKCGKGGKAGCNGCSAAPGAGDPVDICSGDVYVPPVLDLDLPGPIPIELLRGYSSSQADKQMGFGWGWSFAFGWTVEVHGQRLRAMTGRGLELEFLRPALGDIVYAGGCQVSYEGPLVRLLTPDYYAHYFEARPGKPESYRLQRVEGPLQLKIELRYDDRDWLVEVLDTVGRRVIFDRTSRGLVARIRVPDATGASLEFANFRYDDAGNLVTAIEADGGTTTFDYDSMHRLTRHTYPSGFTMHYRYDSAGRCVESWGDLVGSDRDLLVANLPRVLRDGQTPVKGLYHVKLEYDTKGGRTVASTTQLQRFFVDDKGVLTKAVANGGVTTRQFDHRGSVIAKTDRNGQTTTYEYDSRGLLFRETDALGNTVVIDRDNDGRPIAMLDPQGNAVNAHRNAQGFIESIEDQVGAITSYVWDDRALLREMIHPNGSRTEYQTDGHGNVAAVRLANGAVWRWKYDWWGRVVERTDPEGRITHFHKSAAGRTLAIRERDGATTSYHYDAAGDLIETAFPDGTRALYDHGIVGWLRRKVGPDGSTNTFRYNYEGDVLEFVNEAGEVARREYDEAMGLVLQEESYLGVTERYRRDRMGNITALDTPAAGKTLIELDALGLEKTIEFSDGEVWKYERDPRSEIVAAESPRCQMTFDRNAAGYVLAENVTIDGATTVVLSRYSADGRCEHVETSLGYSASYERDAIGSTIAMVIDKTDRVTFSRDLFGSVVEQRLPRGGVIENEYDVLNRLSRTRVRAGTAMATAGKAEPAWLGARRDGVVKEKAYQYSLTSLVTSITTDDGQTQYRYDARDRIIERATGQGPVEQFQYDPISNLFEAGPGAVKRVYTHAGQLVQRGTTVYRYDAEGKMLEKSVATDDGTESVTSYEWTPQYHLAAVNLPDQRRVEFLHDAIGRRALKKVLRPGVDGLQVESVTRYVWHAWSLLQSERVRYDEAGAEVDREQRTYLYSDVDEDTPFGEIHASATGKDTLYYSTDLVGTPEQLVRADGSLAAEIERSAFGTVTVRGDVSTDLRFPGQLADEETGLSYNYCRYYDPELAQYISADPIGIAGGTNLFAYPRNPLVYTDPYGLKKHALEMTVYDSKGNPVGSSSDKSGGYVDENKGTGKAPKYVPGKNGTPAMTFPGTKEGESHTEDKAIHRLKNNEKMKAAMKGGGTAKMKGVSPPCQKCHKKLADYAAKNPNGTVEYHYPVKQCIQYKGDGKGGTNIKATDSGNSPGKKSAKELLEGTGKGRDEKGYHTSPSAMDPQNKPGGEQKKSPYRKQADNGAKHKDDEGAYLPSADTGKKTGGLSDVSGTPK
jgi:RHS repeat-associated protein